MGPRWYLRSSNTSREPRDVLRWTLCAMYFVALAHATDPHRAMSQYLRDRWGVEQGFPSGPVYAITQTADGYLWFGTESGLIRYDGSSFRLIQDSSPEPISTHPVFGLTQDDEGNLWVRLRFPTLLRYRDGQFKNVLADLGFPSSFTTAMFGAKDGGFLVALLGRGTMLYRHGKLDTVVVPGATRSPVISLAQSPDGDIWLGTRETGLFRVRDGQSTQIMKGLPDPKINCLLPGKQKEVWVGTDDGIVRWDGTELTRSGVPPGLDHVQALTMAADRDSNLWIGTGSRGLLRINTHGVASFENPSSHASSNKDRRLDETVTAVFEDREGNLWTGGTSGIERLRDSVFVTYSLAEGMPSQSNGPIFAETAGRTWFAPIDGGLYWLNDGRVGHVAQAGLDKDVVYSIAGHEGDLWIGRQRGGLTHLSASGEFFAARTYTQADGLAQNSVYAVYQNRDGSIWAGTLSGGVSHLQNGKFTTYTTANGLPSNTITAILEDRDGTMWFATPGGLASLSNGKWRNYTIDDGLPSDDIDSLLQDSAGTLWIGTARGLASLQNGRIHAVAADPASLHEQILGLAEDGNGAIWITTSSHVLRMQVDKARRGDAGESTVREYGLADGLRGIEGVKRHRTVVADPLGRIWLSMNRGLSVVDPTRLTRDPAPAIVHIQGISADGKAVPMGRGIRVPAGRQRLTFSYAGLSLSVPERVRFRYKLDGFDQNWSEPVAAREAIYTNLGPASYRFRVMASNADGLWNGIEDAAEFQIEPAYWQTWWFRLSCLAFGALAIAGFYRLRVFQLTRQLNSRFDERMAERTRLARELHDTLLQTIQGSKLVADDALDDHDDPARMRRSMERLSTWLAQATQEGRAALHALRNSNQEGNDLVEALQRAGEECLAKGSMEFILAVEGSPRDLHPIVRDEVQRIGFEAIRNASAHSMGSRLEVDLSYASDLTLRVRDNGRGIEPAIAAKGKPGHYGLQGMQERATRVGGRLHLFSSANSGTEIELVVPGGVAFRDTGIPFSARIRRLLGRKSGTAKS